MPKAAKVAMSKRKIPSPKGPPPKTADKPPVRRRTAADKSEALQSCLEETRELQQALDNDVTDHFAEADGAASAAEPKRSERVELQTKKQLEEESRKRKALEEEAEKLTEEMKKSEKSDNLAKQSATPKKPRKKVSPIMHVAIS